MGGVYCPILEIFIEQEPQNQSYHIAPTKNSLPENVSSSATTVVLLDLPYATLI
jgi:hypothetical protein